MASSMDHNISCDSFFCNLEKGCDTHDILLFKQSKTFKKIEAAFKWMRQAPAPTGDILELHLTMLMHVPMLHLTALHLTRIRAILQHFLHGRIRTILHLFLHGTRIVLCFPQLSPLLPTATSTAIGSTIGTNMGRQLA